MYFDYESQIDHIYRQPGSISPGPPSFGPLRQKHGNGTPINKNGQKWDTAQSIFDV